MWAQKQSDLGPHCLPVCKNRFEKFAVLQSRRQKRHFQMQVFLVNINRLVELQSTLVISNSNRLSEILRDIRTSTYQSYRIEEKIIRTTTFDKYMCNWTLEVRDILKILWKRISPLFHNIFYLSLDFHVQAGTRFSLRDKRLFEISEVEITRVNCNHKATESNRNTETNALDDQYY